MMRPPIRLFLALYTSLIVHACFLVYYFNSGRDWTNRIVVCGPPWVYELQEERERALEFSFQMGEESGTEDAVSEFATGKEGEESDGFPGNPYFDKEKYAGGPWEDLIEKLEESSELRKNFRNQFDNIVRDGSVQDSYIFRKRDYEDITVKEVFPTIHNIDKPFHEEVQNAPEDLILYKERNRIIDMYRNSTEDADLMTMELSIDGEKRSKSPLVMPREERMKYLDKHLPRRKEDQLKEFTSRFLNYDPDKGDLPHFYRDLYYENLQRLAYNFSVDPTYFTIDYFQENLNKEDFLKNSLALYSEFRNRKLGAEILFALENIYEIQARALGLYFQNLQSFPMLSEESRKELRVEVIRRVLEKYKPILREKKIQSVSDVNRLYLQKRLEIIDTLISDTPDEYRVADARFEKGRMLWEYSLYLPDSERREYQEKAMFEWSRINPNASTGDFLNQKTYEELKRLTNGFQIANPAVNPRSPTPQSPGFDPVSVVLRERLTNVLHEKRLREEKLLWKKKPASQPNLQAR